MSLEGKVALVTGAGRGIGPGIARVLAKKGMIVAVNARTESAEQTAADLRALGLQATAFMADVSRKAEVEAMIERVEQELGPLWLLVNNAGLLRAAPTAEMAEADRDDVFAVDAKGVFLCAQAAIRRMMPRGAGRIVNIASIAGMIVRTKQIAYSSAKAATIHFSRSSCCRDGTLWHYRQLFVSRDDTHGNAHEFRRRTWHRPSRGGGVDSQRAYGRARRSRSFGCLFCLG